MMRTLALILALMLAPAAGASAREVAVQSGEHVDFSRLVLRFDASDGWVVGRVPGGYEFRATDSSVSFDTSGVFRLIPRTRIAAVTAPAPGVLRLKVDCTCHIDAFELRHSRIVIDVKDGAPPASDQFEKPLPAVVEASAAPAPVPAPTPAPPPHGPLVGRLAEAAKPKHEVPLELPSAEVPAPELDIARAQRTRDFEEAVLQEMARAGAQGLIVPAGDDALKNIRKPDHKAEAAGDHAPAPEVAAESLSDETRHVKIQTAVDRDALGARRAPVTHDGGACPDEALMDMTTWGRLIDGLPDIGKAREGLVTEFDTVDPERALELARFYTWLGFGAEAAETLAYVPDGKPAKAVLGAMAEIEDHEGNAPVGMALDGFESCDSSAALWAVLAGAPLARGQAVDADAVVLAFGELPGHLQTLLGPRLIAAFTNIDQLETATMLRNETMRQPEKTVEAVVADADLQTARGDHAAAEEVLDQALKQDDPDSPEVLLALARSQMDNGKAPDDKLVAALEAIAYERRGEPLAAQIVAVLARAHISRGEFRVARDMVSRQVAPQDAELAAGLLRQLYLAAADRAGESDFLRLALAGPAGLGDTRADAPARQAVAGRLLAMGFPDEALEVIGRRATGDDHDFRILAARAHLAKGEPDAALALLAALGGRDATMLLAQAQAMGGHFSAAERLYRTAGADAEADQAALMAQDWGGLTKAQDPKLQAMGQQLSAALPPAFGDPYKAADALIAQSEKDRAAIEAALIR